MIGKTAIVSMVRPGYLEVRYEAQTWKARIIGNNDTFRGDTVVIKDVISNTLVVTRPGSGNKMQQGGDEQS